MHNRASEAVDCGAADVAVTPITSTDDAVGVNSTAD